MKFALTHTNPKKFTVTETNRRSWMDLPYFALPSTGVCLMVGETYTIYGDTLINVAINNNLHIAYTCDIGAQSGVKDFVVTPTAAQVGSHSLTMVMTDGMESIGTYTISFAVYTESPVGAMSILQIGDSTMGDLKTSLDSVLNGCTTTYIGTKGTTMKNEGNPGYRYYDYLFSNAGNVSPFFFSGAFNFFQYFSANGLVYPTIIYLRLGINDIAGYTGFGTDTQLNTTIGYIDDILDYMIADYAIRIHYYGVKIIVALPTVCTKRTDLWINDYGTLSQDAYIKSMHSFCKKISDRYANGAYNGLVDCSYESMHINRIIGYQNGVHPNAAGYVQIAKGLVPYMNKYYREYITPSQFSSEQGSGYIDLFWFNKAGNTMTFEIEANNGSGWTNITTTAGGAITYRYTYSGPALTFRIRGKLGTWYSDYVTEASLGAELVGATWNAVGGAYWDIQFDASWTGDGSKLISNGTGEAKRNNFWEVGKQYRIRLSITVTSGVLYVYNGYRYDLVYYTTGTHVWFYEPNYTTGFNPLDLFGNAFVGEITELSIKEVL